MKYTNYSYKRKKKNTKGIFPIIIITLLSISIGLGLAWIVYDQFLRESNEEKVIKTDGQITEDKNDNIQVSTKEGRYIFIQCGYFSKKENADVTYNKVQDELLSFVVEEDGKFRVSAGIYTEDEGNKKMKELMEKGIETSKMTFSIKGENNIEKQVLAIIDGYLKILNKLGEDDVKSYNTNEFKDYVKGLEVTESGENIDDLKKLKEHISKVPENMTKSDVKNELNFIFNILVKYKQ